MGTHVISPQGLNAVEWTGAMAMYMDKFGTLPSSKGRKTGKPGALRRYFCRP
jgi:hypothetical protein